MHELALQLISLCMGGTGRSGEGKVPVASAGQLPRQGLEDRIGWARMSAEPRECRQGNSKTCLQGFYHRHVIRGNKVVSCAVLKKKNLTAPEMFSHRASDRKLYDPRKQE